MYNHELGSSRCLHVFTVVYPSDNLETSGGMGWCIPATFVATWRANSKKFWTEPFEAFLGVRARTHFGFWVVRGLFKRPPSKFLRKICCFGTLQMMDFWGIRAARTLQACGMRNKANLQVWYRVKNTYCQKHELHFELCTHKAFT